MPDDRKRRLQEVQQHLADAARAIDAASINVRTMLANDHRDRKQAPYQPKEDDDADRD